MKVSDYIAKKLAEARITKAFLVQGAANNDLIYSIADTPGIDYVCPMHEQAAGFMAEGYAKVKGVPGVAIGTSGPGGQNLITCAANFYYDSTPGIFITGQVNSRFMRGPQSPLRQIGFQEWPATEAFAPVTKASFTLSNPKHVRNAIEFALFTAMNGRPGPVHIDIPIDVQRAEVDPSTLIGYPGGRAETRPDAAAQLKMLIQDLHTAKRPVLLFGGGTNSSEAARSLARQLINLLKIPAFPTWNAIDVVTSDMEYYGGRVGTYGGPGRNFAIQNCDLLIAIGCRLSGRITGGNINSFARAAKRYVVDIDRDLCDPDNQQLPFHVSINRDAAAFMATLISEIRNYSYLPDRSEWMRQAIEWRDKYDPVHRHFTGHGVDPYMFARILGEEVSSDAVIVYDCGGNAVVMNHAFKTTAGQRYFSNNGNSPMGFSMCGAMGAWFAAPEREIICIIGDGGFNMNIQELRTIAANGINVKVFILNNQVYGITKQYQENNMGGRFEACGPRGYSSPATFQSIVEAYGVQFFRLYNNDMIRNRIRRVLYHTSAAVCEVDCYDFHTYEPRISGWATPIEDMTPVLPREEFRQNMIIDPLPGWETGDYKEV